MIRIGAAALTLFALMLPLTGCWSRHELNEQAIVVGIGIDKEGSGYTVSAQMVNPATVSGQRGVSKSLPPVVTHKQWGQSVPEALRRMTTNLSKRLYFSHLRIVVFGEEVAREGIRGPLDFFSREPKMRTDFYLIVARNCTASDVLSMSTVIDPIPANHLYEKLSVSDREWAATGKITLDELLINLASQGKSSALTGIRIVGDKRNGASLPRNDAIKQRTFMEYSGMAVFRKDRMIGWMEDNEVRALKYLQNTVDQTVWVMPCSGGKSISLNLVRARTRIRAASNGDLPVIHVYSRIELDVASVECEADLSKPDTLERIRKQAQNHYRDILLSSIEGVQRRFGTDIFGFGKHVHRQLPKLWRNAGKWDEAFARLQVRVHPDVQIRRVGSIEKPVEVRE